MSYRLLIPLVLLVAVGCQPPQAPPPPSEPEPTTEPAPPTRPTGPDAPTADRTLAYWQGVGQAQEVAARRYAALTEPKPDEVSKLLTEAAKVMDELATEKVDPDAVAVGKGLADGLRKRATEPAAAGTALTDAAGKARKMRADLTTRYSREFPPLDTPPAKPAAFRLAADLGRPTAAQELARLKAEIAVLDGKYKEVGKELSAEVTERDKLQSAVEDLRNRLKDQKEDRELKQTRQEALDFALKDLGERKQVVEGLTRKRNALQTQKGDLDRLALELTGVLTDGAPAKAEAMPADRLELLRQRIDNLNEKLDAQKTPPAPPPGGGK